MNRNEVIDLLSIVQAFDKRTVGEPDVIAWEDSARRCRWTYVEAAEAVKDYYARTTSERPFIMPSHITNSIRRNREYQSMRFQQDATPANPRVVEAIEPVAEKTKIPDPTRPMRNSPLTVPCPHCKAPAGESCTRPRLTGRPIPMLPHPSRKELALDMKNGGVRE